MQVLMIQIIKTESKQKTWQFLVSFNLIQAFLALVLLTF